MSKDDEARYAAWKPETDKEQKEAVTKERADGIASLPAVQDILDWFDEQLQELHDPTLLPVTVATEAEEIKSQLLLAKDQVKRFTKKREEFASRFAQYLP